MAQDTTGLERWITSTGFTIRRNDQTVLEAARERIRECFSLADTVVVSYSGGKDSTVAFNLTLEIARELGRLPLEVMMFDEEVIDPDTLALCDQVRQSPEVNFRWFCVPIRHTLRSQHRVYWWTWDPRERSVWARDLPPHAIASIPGFEMGTGGIPEASAAYYNTVKAGRMIEIAGIRVEESFNRRRALVGAGAWMVPKHGYRYAKVIWDWTWQDVWRAIRTFGWPYSKFYDKMFARGVTPFKQRVAPWGNVASAFQVQIWPSFYPDFWDRAIRRLPELRPQARYGDTKLYRKNTAKPIGLTWQEYTFKIIAEFDDDATKLFWLNHIRDVLAKYERKNTLPFPDVGAEIIGPNADGGAALQSWKRLAQIIVKNDRTGRDKT